MLFHFDRIYIENGVSDNPNRGRNTLTKIYTNFRKRYQKNLALFSPEFYCTIIRSTQPLSCFYSNGR